MFIKKIVKNQKIYWGMVIVAFLLLAGLPFILQGSKYSADASCETGVPIFKQTAYKGLDDNGNVIKAAYLYGRRKNSSGQWIKADIASSGCGPTALAMVLAYKMGNGNMTPDVAASYCLNNGFRPPDGGTHPDCFDAYAREKGFKADEVSSREAKNLLRKGIPIIMTVGGCQQGKYTSGGHYIVLTLIRDEVVDGKTKTIVLINDPNKDNTWDYPENIFNSCYRNGYWFIHK